MPQSIIFSSLPKGVFCVFKKYIGNAAFYKTVISVAMPIMIQNAITNFVSLLDNIMVGRLGTLEMSGVSIVNQLMFVFNICFFGAAAGAGIFTAQFSGSGDHEGVRHTFRFKVIAMLVLGTVLTGVLAVAGAPLSSLYLKGNATAEEVSLTLSFAKDYIKVMIFGLLPFALSNAYSSTMRETGQTVVPMVSSVSAVGVNLMLNYILIFGKLGAPALGVVGAAVATVISRWAELLINVLWLHTHSATNPFIKGAYRGFYIPKRLVGQICIKGLPLLSNELCYGSGIAILNQCHSTRGIDVVAATNISGVVFNLFSVCFLALGSAVSIIMGQMLGANKPHSEIRDTNRKLIAFAVMICVVVGGFMAAFSGLFPKIYNTSDDVRSLAQSLICISAAVMPVSAYNFAAFFTLRSGGKSLLTFLFDGGSIWILFVPTAFLLSRLTSIPIIPLYAICQGLEIIKSLFGGYLIKKGSWLQNLTNK